MPPADETPDSKVISVFQVTVSPSVIVSFMLRSTFYPVFLLSSVLPMFSQSTLWNATWMLDRSHSAVQGPTITLTRSTSNSFRFFSSAFMYDFQCDGKDYTVGDSVTYVSCAYFDGNLLDVTYKKKGAPVFQRHYELSNGGQNLIVITTDFQQANKLHMSREYKRIDHSRGLSGQWQDPNAITELSEYMSTSMSDTTFDMFVPGQQHTKINLSEQGPRIQAPDGNPGTLWIKVESPRVLFLTRKRNGQILGHVRMTISEDGRTLVEQMLGKDGAEPMGRYVYIRQ